MRDDFSISFSNICIPCYTNKIGADQVGALSSPPYFSVELSNANLREFSFSASFCMVDGESPPGV